MKPIGPSGITFTTKRETGSRASALRSPRPANDRKDIFCGEMGAPEGGKGRFPQASFVSFGKIPLKIGLLSPHSRENTASARQASPCSRRQRTSDGRASPLSSGSMRHSRSLSGRTKWRLRRYLSEPSFLLLLCHFKQTFLPSVICLLTNTSFLAPVFYYPPTAPARIDSFCPQCQFFLFVERLQLSCHENTPVSRIVSASCKYYLLLYGSIVTYCKCRCKSWGGLTLTL